MMKKKRKLFQEIRHTYKFKVMISFFSILMLPIIILLMISYSSLITSYKDEVLRRDENIYASNTQELEDLLHQLYVEVIELKANSTLKNFFRTSEFSGDVLFAYHQYIENILTWESMLKPDTVKEYVFFTKNRNIPRSVQIRLYEDLPSSLDREEMQKAFLKGQYVQKLFIESEFDSHNKYGYRSGYYLYFPYIFNDEYYTVIQVEVDIESAALALERFDRDFYYLQFGNQGYFNVQTGSYSKQDIDREQFDINYISYDNDLFNGDIHMIKYTNIPTLLFDVNKLEKRFWQIVIGCLIILTIIIYLFASVLTRKLVRVSHHIEQLEDDNFELFVSTTNNDEIDILTNHINLLTQRVKGLTEKKYETELLLKKTEIQALQNQITPHFLYNTLESFKMLALMNDQIELSEGLTSLGQLLRYFTKTGNSLSHLGWELDSVEDYLCIQNLLQNNRIILNLEIDPLLYNVQIPNLILQPIIENVIKHGTLKQTDRVAIVIQSYLKDENLVIKIHDNGIGIQQDLVTKLNSGFQTDRDLTDRQDDKHIGLMNVNQRIKLLLGESFGLSIDPQVSRGTNILIRLPLIESKQKNTP